MVAEIIHGLKLPATYNATYGPVSGATLRYSIAINFARELKADPRFDEEAFMLLAVSGVK